jgi:signal transduction histidine kinase
MVNRQWSILLVEDDEDDYILVKDIVSNTRGQKLQLEWVSSYEAGKQAILAKPYDAILMDYQLGPRTGLDLTREVTALGCKAPIILLTGRGNYDIDLEAMETGVTDYLAKSEANPASLERSIRYAILQKQTEEMLRSAKEELETRVQERTRELTDKNAALESVIAERERMQNELAEVQGLLIDRTEAERRELARDLHDGPMQELYALTYQMETLADDFSAGRGLETTAGIKKKLLQVIQSLRTLGGELRPPSLAPYGLEKAIRSHAESLMQAHPDLNIRLKLDEDRQSLPEPVRMALFRIYQTSITNVIRHAGASQADVRLHLNQSKVILEIQDNGCGFKVPKRWIEFARQDHLGLVGAAERAEAAGGKLQVESAPSKGTLVRVIVPRNPTLPRLLH